MNTPKDIDNWHILYNYSRTEFILFFKGRAHRCLQKTHHSSSSKNLSSDFSHNTCNCVQKNTYLCTRFQKGPPKRKEQILVKCLRRKEHKINGQTALQKSTSTLAI